MIKRFLFILAVLLLTKWALGAVYLDGWPLPYDNKPPTPKGVTISITYGVGIQFAAAHAKATAGMPVPPKNVKVENG